MISSLIYNREYLLYWEGSIIGDIIMGYIVIPIAPNIVPMKAAYLHPLKVDMINELSNKNNPLVSSLN